jgi:hypothetical protein
MVNIEELIGTTEYLTLQGRCRINRCRSNRVRLYVESEDSDITRYSIVHDELVPSS